MKSWSIRHQLLLSALLPASLVALLLATTLMAGRFSDLDDAHVTYSEGLARQIAASAEHAVFSGNEGALQKLVDAAVREPDVAAAGIFGPGGELLAWQGQAQIPELAELRRAVHPVHAEFGARMRLLLPMRLTDPLPPDPFDEPIAATKALPAAGYVLLELSREHIMRSKMQAFGTGLLALLAAMGLAAALATRISQRISGPIQSLVEVVDRIGGGELTARVAPQASTISLRRLESGVNTMADAIFAAQQTLRREIEAATAELRRKKEEAESAAHARSRFLAAASHDLRQPLHALGMFVARLNQFEHPPRVGALVSQVEESVDALRCLLDTLLDISRLDAGSVGVRPSGFPIVQLLKRLRDDYALIAAGRGLLLAVRPTRYWVHSDPVLLERILRNLVTNALRYTARGGILVACRRRGDLLRIEVWDTGCGIAPESQQEVFLEFVQLGNPERDRGKGLGLGLAIVNRIAGRLGHPIKLCSQPNRGSMFAISVPLAAPAAVEACRTPAALVKLPAMTVVVIDDDPLVRQGMTELLEGWGCRTLTAACGSDALARLGPDGVPDLLLCDYRLANGETGFMTLQQFRARYGAALPAVLMTAETGREIAGQARELGLALLYKPVPPARLRTLLNRLAAGHERTGSA